MACCYGFCGANSRGLEMYNINLYISDLFLRKKKFCQIFKILQIWQKLVLNQLKILFSEKYTTDMIPNRMRNIHAVIDFEFGKKNVVILRKLEKLEKKIADLQKHRRFTLRCLSQNISSTSIKLKSNIKTPPGS